MLGDISKFCGDKPIKEITPTIVRQWVESHETWHQTTRSIAYKQVNAMFVRLREYGIKDNPVQGVIKRPQSRVRGEDILIPASDYMAVLDASIEPYKAIWQLLHETGCRPSEVLTLTAEEIDWHHHEIVKKHHKTASPGKSRVIMLTAAAAEILKYAAAKNPDGYVFRNNRGGPIYAPPTLPRIREPQSSDCAYQAPGHRIRSGTGLPSATWNASATYTRLHPFLEIP